MNKACKVSVSKLLTASVCIFISFSHLANSGCTLSAELVLDGLDASLLLDEVVDDLGGLLVLQLGLGDAAHVEQVLQLWVQVVHLQDREGKD